MSYSESGLSIAFPGAKHRGRGNNAANGRWLAGAGSRMGHRSIDRAQLV